MNSRSNWTLALLAAAVLTFILVVERHLRVPGELVVPPRVLPQLQVDAVTSVQVRPEGRLEIRVDRTNQLWQLTKPLTYPAESAAVDNLLRALAGLSGQTRLTADDLGPRANATKDFGLDPPSFSLVVQQPGGRMQILIGNRTALKDQVFLQVVGSDAIFVVDAGLLRYLPLVADDWRSRALVNLKDLAFDRIVVTNAGKAFELERDAVTRLWRLAPPIQARADSPKIEDLLQKLQDLRVVRFVPDEPPPDLDALGFRPPDLELGLAQGTNALLSLQFGVAPTNDAALVYARNTASGAVVLVPAAPLAGWRGGYTEFRDRRLVTITQNLVDEVDVRGVSNFRLRRLTNDVWQITGTNGFAADPALVYDLLGNFSALQVAQFVKGVVTPLDLPGYGLEPPVRQYLLRSAATNAPGVGTNGLIAELQFGKADGDLVYARRTDENSVYGVRLRDFLRLPAAPWQLRDRHLWSFTENDVARLSLRPQGQTFDLVRTGTNQWTVPAPAQPIVNDLALDETLRRFGELSAASWVAVGDALLPRLGFTTNSPQITVQLKSGASVTVEFGGLSPHSLPYAATRLDGQTWIFEFPWSVYQYLQAHLGFGMPAR